MAPDPKANHVAVMDREAPSDPQWGDGNGLCGNKAYKATANNI